jgi:hypothetical protein
MLKKSLLTNLLLSSLLFSSLAPLAANAGDCEGIYKGEVNYLASQPATDGGAGSVAGVLTCAALVVPRLIYNYWSPEDGFSMLGNWNTTQIAVLFGCGAGGWLVGKIAHDESLSGDQAREKQLTDNYQSSLSAIQEANAGKEGPGIGYYLHDLNIIDPGSDITATQVIDAVNVLNKKGLFCDHTIDLHAVFLSKIEKVILPENLQ